MKTNLVSYTCVYMNTAVLSEYIVLTVKHSIRKRAIGKTMGAYMFALPQLYLIYSVTYITKHKRGTTTCKSRNLPFFIKPQCGNKDPAHTNVPISICGYTSTTQSN